MTILSKEELSVALHYSDLDEAMIHSHQFRDSRENPEGGHTFGRGFAIAWQRGPLGRGEERQEPNGAFVEDIILAAKDRLLFYQGSKFKCEENAEAIRCLDAALNALYQRTKKREERGVEGTHDQ